MERIFNIYLIVSVFTLFTTHVFGATGVGKVLLLKGEVLITNSLSNSKSFILKKDDVLQQGATIQVSKNSFVKMILSDNSQISLGPESKMVLQQYPVSSKDKVVGVINLIKGKIRAEVTKDPLNLAAKEGKSKLFIKTEYAAMGVRGTQLIVSQNEHTGASSCVTLEGSVRVAPFNASVGEGPKNPQELAKNLEAAVSGPKAVAVTEGTFSAVMKNAETPTPSTKISPHQFEGLKNNTTFLPPSKEAIEAARSAPKFISIVPPGISAFKAAAGQEGMQAALLNAVGSKVLQETFQEAVKKEMVAKGMVSADGKPMPMGPGGTPMMGPGGTPMMGAAGAPMMGPGGAPMMGSAGAPMMGAAGAPMMGAAGAPMMGAAGAPMMGPGGSTAPTAMFTAFQNTMNKMDTPPPMTMGPLPGGMIDLNNPGVYISPPANALYDPNTKTFAPSPMVAGVDPSTGDIVHYKGFSMSESGHLVFNAAEFKQGPQNGPQGNLPSGSPGMPAGTIGPNGMPAGMMGPNGMPAGTMGPNGMPAGMMGPNGMPAGTMGAYGMPGGMMGPNGMPAGTMGPNGMPAGTMGPNGMPAGTMGPNGMPAGTMGPNGMPAGTMEPYGMPAGTIPPVTGQYNPTMDPYNPTPQCTTCSTFPTPAENYCSLHPQDTQVCGGGGAANAATTSQVNIIITAP